MIARLTALILGLGLLSAAFPAFAHSPDDVLRELRETEPYLQLTEREAPGFVLEDPDGGKLGLADFRGKVVILNFIYARCTDVCPLHSELIATLQDQTDATLMRDQVQFVTIATDTEDAAATAEAMRAHGKAHGLDPRNWIFLYRGSGEPEAGIRLAKAYGLEFTQVAEGARMHGVVTHVIDQNGILRARFHGLRVQPLNVTAFVNALVYPEHHGPGAVPGPTPAATGSAPPPEQSWSTEALFQAGLGVGFALLGSGWLLLNRRRRKGAPQGGREETG